MAEFDAVLFDAGGVLLLPSPELTGPLVARFGGSPEADLLMRAHFVGTHAMDHAMDHERSRSQPSDWMAYEMAYLEVAGVPAAVLEEAAGYFHERFLSAWWRQPVPGAKQALIALAERGVPTGIVSNASGTVEADLAELGICGVDTPGAAPVSCVVDSDVVGVRKPDPAIFRYALEELDLPASPRIAYVGDTVFFDVRSATAAGLTPLLHDPYALHVGDPHPTGPHRLLSRLADLLELV